MTDANSRRPPRDGGGEALEERAASRDGAPRPTPGGLRGAIELIAGPQPFKWDLGRIATAVMVPVFCWVFFTTSSGMVDIMRRESNDWIGLIGAFIGATAILVMLASTSWSLGADLGALIAKRHFLGERIIVKTIVTSCVFVFVFSISAFFSFTYYYTNIFLLSSKKIVSELQPMELAADVLLPAAKSIDTKYDEETVRIVSMQGMRSYLESLDALIFTASNAGPGFREGIRKNYETLQRAAQDAAKKAAAELQEAQAAARQLDEVRGRIAALEQTAADLEPIIKSKQDEIAALVTVARQEDQLAVDAAKGLDNLGAACGTNCESHRAKASAARKRIITIRETLVAPVSERASAVKQRDALAAQAVTFRQRAESAASSRAQAAPLEESAPDLAAALRELAESRADIRANPNLAKIRKAKISCGVILATARQANMAPPAVPGDFDCEPSSVEVRELLGARDEVIAGRAAFGQKCALDGPIHEQMTAISLRIRNAPSSDKSAASNGFNDAKQIVDACIVAGKAAGLSESDVQGFLKRSDAYLRSHSMDRNRFEMAREAFLSFTPDATMAIGVAVAQDAFMFVMKLLSEIFRRGARARERAPLPPAMDLADHEAEASEMRLMKALLREARPLHGATSAFDAEAPGVASLPEHVRGNLVALLNRLVREGAAYVDRKGCYILDNRTLMEIEARLAAIMKRTGGRIMDARHAASLAGETSAAWPRRRRRSALDRYFSAQLFGGTETDGADRTRDFG